MCIGGFALVAGLLLLFVQMQKELACAGSSSATLSVSLFPSPHPWPHSHPCLQLNTPALERSCGMTTQVSIAHAGGCGRRWASAAAALKVAEAGLGEGLAVAAGKACCGRHLPAAGVDVAAFPAPAVSILAMPV